MRKILLDWQFGDDEPVVDGREDDLTPASDSTPRPASLRWGLWLLAFLLALVLSWSVGFYIGGAQRARATLESELQARLDLEAWAWQQGDWRTFRSLFPRNTPGWRLQTLRAAFDATAPEAREMILADYRLQGNDAFVVADVITPQRRYQVQRHYRREGGRWWLMDLENIDGETTDPGGWVP